MSIAGADLEVAAVNDPGGPVGPASPPPDPPGGSGRPRHGVVRWIIRELAITCVTAGVVLFLFVGYQLFGTGIAEANSQSKLKQQFDHLVAPGARGTEPPPTITPTSNSPSAAPTTTATPTTSATAAPPSAPVGSAVAHLVIPKIGVDKFIVDDVTIEALRKGPGHYPQTPMPGNTGNAAIAGHRTTYGAPFYRLNELKPGDDIFITTLQGQFHYTVLQSEVVKPTDSWVLNPTTDSRLTLTTCNPRFSAATRLVVVSTLVTPPSAPVAQPAPSPAVQSSGVVSAGAVLGDQQPLSLGRGDKGAWPPTLLFGALTLLLWVGVRVWGADSVHAKRLRGKRRWIRFALGIPVCLVPLWFLFENVMRLLPANV